MLCVCSERVVNVNEPPFPPSSNVPVVYPGHKKRDITAPGLYTDKFLQTVPPHSLSGVMWETRWKGAGLPTVSQSPADRPNMDNTNNKYLEIVSHTTMSVLLECYRVAYWTENTQEKRFKNDSA